MILYDNVRARWRTVDGKAVAVDDLKPSNSNDFRKLKVSIAIWRRRFERSLTPITDLHHPQAVWF